MARKKYTRNQEAYKKEINRIKNFVRRASKRGFIFEDVIPDMPNIVTQKRLREIRKQTPELLYRKAKYIDPVTGDIFTGTEGRYLERYRAAKYGKAIPKIEYPIESDIVLDNVIELINNFSPRGNWSAYWSMVKTRDKDKIKSLLDSTINNLGRRKVIENIQTSSEDIMELTDSILYSSDEEQVEFNIIKFSQIITKGTLSSYETAELSEYMEANESIE